ncbi:hypothetical protein ACMX2H_16080 [Arthrobacter sulfonylureivorans]|uniref:hypothetical protein n=1 Tax=Arthrobacter sulfonylureivorans TaxID=2486855 RepID=UPI0039E4E97F
MTTPKKPGLTPIPRNPNRDYPPSLLHKLYRQSYVPTEQEYAILLLVDQHQAAVNVRERIKATKADTKLARARAAAAERDLQTHNDAETVRQWALRRWPEPNELGAKRLEAATRELNPRHSKQHPGHANRLALRALKPLGLVA